MGARAELAASYRKTVLQVGIKQDSSSGNAQPDDFLLTGLFRVLRWKLQDGRGRTTFLGKL